MRTALLLLLFTLSGCISTQNKELLYGSIASNVDTPLDHEPLEDIWEKVYSTKTQELWVDSTNQIVVFKKDGKATLLFSDIDNEHVVELYDDNERFFSFDNAYGNRYIVFERDDDNNLWWYVDKDGDGIVDIRFIEGVDDSSEELRSKLFKPYDSTKPTQSD